ncbi:PRC-barrel domain-containing protein [Microvirga splendida]|uniref:PRC-barrel domain-containing protein n=1 Tax=Microvirga splendida TaxID=2795727 RepID=A0ABS0Y2M0_9HYPH|nr:PRC-barrel domain-containing protein [Microvirga splendida]MBJ6126548.1 PRC-barrel domain-containing protein [Microvirga splendida]
MLKTHMAVCLMATGLIAAPALAQTSPTAPATNTAPVTTPAGPAGSTMGANPNATTGAAAGNATMAGGSFMTQREPGMYSASELIGKDVMGANNEDIGEIGDVLIDRNGQVRAVVVDVGGFLGIGETHVAIPMQQVQMRPNQRNAATTGTAGTTAAGNTTGSTGTTTTTGATGTAGQNTAAAGNRGADDMVIVVMTTKDQLKNAPKFEEGARRQ